MTARTLILKDSLGRSLEIKSDTGGLTLVQKNEAGERVSGAFLTREWAHLLYLYLNECFGP